MPQHPILLSTLTGVNDLFVRSNVIKGLWAEFLHPRGIAAVDRGVCSQAGHDRTSGHLLHPGKGSHILLGKSCHRTSVLRVMSGVKQKMKEAVGINCVGNFGHQGSVTGLTCSWSGFKAGLLLADARSRS